MKAGTPTMGGIIILIAVILTTLKFAVSGFDTLILLSATVGFGLIGFADDFIKVVKKRNLGLRAKQKLLYQCLVTVVLFVLLWWENGRSLEGFFVNIPFTHFGVGTRFLLCSLSADRVARIDERGQPDRWP